MRTIFKDSDVEIASSRQGFLRRRGLPWVVGLFGVLSVFLLWHSLQRSNRQRLADETRLTAGHVQLRLEAWIDSRTALIRVAASGYADEVYQRWRFDAFADELLELFPGLQAFNRIDNSGVITVIKPGEGNEPALGRNVHDHPDPGIGEAFDRAAATGDLSVGPVVDLFQGHRGVTTYMPTFDTDGKLVAFINCVFSIDKLVDICLAEASLREHYRFRIREPGGEVVCLHADTDPDGSWAGAVTLPVRFINQTWSMELAPSRAKRAAASPHTTSLLALVGMALALLFAFLIALHMHRLEQLAESEARYRLLVENTRDFIVRVDGAGRFLYVSPSYCELFGRTADDLLGHEFMPLVHEDDRGTTAQEMMKLQVPPHTCDLEQRAMSATGWRWLSWSDTAVVDDAGEIVEIIGVGRDVTERKELEAQLRQSQKLQAVGELAGGMAHDFNNILQVILGNLLFVREDLPADHPAQEELRLIQSSSERGAQLTRQLLTFSRHQVLQSLNIDLNELVARQLRLLQRTLGEAVSLEFQPGKLEGSVVADPGQIELALTNLCVNARDATSETGRIVVATTAETLAGRVVDTAPRHGDYVRIEVSDDGCGMDLDTLDRIFEPFFTTKAQSQGTGLGLAIVYGILRQHDGFIEARSEPGAGATFRFWLPRSDDPVVSSVPDESRALTGGQETILLAEDDSAVREFARRALERAGYTVLAAEDGDEAVALAGDHDGVIDLALLDVIMPGQSGPDALTSIRADRPGLPAVFASGYAPDDEARPGVGCSACSFIAKPYRLHELLDAVRSMLDERAAT